MRVFAIATILCFVCVFGASRGEEGNPIRKALTIDDLEQRPIIGRLGIPLHEMGSIEGYWTFESRKDDALWFNVTRVNGEQLPRPARFHQAQVFAEYKQEEYRPRQGERWRGRAYETGQFDVTPAAYWKESGHKIVGLPGWRRPGFSSRLQVIVRETSEMKPDARVTSRYQRQTTAREF
jgi:hypothetical protein